MEEVVVPVFQMSDQVPSGKREMVRIGHIGSFSSSLHRAISAGKGKAWDLVKGSAPVNCLHQFGHDRCPVPSNNAVNRWVREILRDAGGVNSTDKGDTIRIPLFDPAAELLHLIDTGDIGTGSNHFGLELPEPAFEPPLDDHVEDLNFVTSKACGDVLEFEGFTDHEVLQANCMVGDRWTNE
jgi:hypothetical protein